MYRLLLALTMGLATPGWCSWPSGPSFVVSPGNVTVSEGSHAFLPCRVANLGDKSVTWMRRRNLHIISAGLLTYSPDDRYRVLHPASTDEWTLHIRHAQPGDGGWYECQVNSDPKITTPVLLTVRDKILEDPFYLHDLTADENNTMVRIEGTDERYIQKGSILAITCTVDHKERAGPSQVAWYQGAARLHYDSPRGGIALQTEKSPSRTVSRLKLSAVTPTDSGRYSCRPDTGGFASIILHIQADQPRAAVQQSGHNASLSPSSSLRLALLLRVLAYLLVHTHR
ncbi:basement membrane-specific heparan sulfate proteoglycan core protein-like [Portunus trituberculatus]|uniref:basement membrane-specific heparan sulfate proteoglycan core protein-like n=1 Tax=Portunus trituberculatus TaxID=210409 RepID=UPI001E1D2065|nr:basement membrane-specific heparan sulfate proteoglycan core protein-like [Portunus trituberculatus]